MAFEVGSIVSKLVLDLKDWKKSVKIVQGDLDKTRKRFRTGGEAAGKLGKTLTRSVTLPLLAMGAAAIKAALDINEGLARVGTLIPGQVKELEKYKIQIQSLGPAMGKSATDLTNGLFQVISAIGKTGQEMKILEINAKAGAAGMSTTEEAIRLTTAVTKGYGDTSEEAFQKAADLAFKTNELGQTTFPELASSMGRVIPVAAAMNVSQEELFASMATLTGVTGNAAEVSTQMAAILRGMLKPTGGMTTALEKLEVASADTLIQQKGLVGGMRALIGTTDGSKVAIGKLFRRAEALNAIFALTGGQAETFDKKFVKMNKSMGSADKAFDEIKDGINKTGFQLKQFIQRIVVVAQKFGDALMPAFQMVMDILEPFVKTISDAVSWFMKWPKFLKGTVIGLIATVAAIGPVLKGIKGLNRVLSFMPAKIQAVGSQMSISFGVYIAVLTAAIIVTKAIFNAIEAGHKRAMTALGKTIDKTASNWERLSQFQKVASDADKAFIKRSLDRTAKIGVSTEQATTTVLAQLKERSEGYRKFDSIVFMSVKEREAKRKAILEQMALDEKARLAALAKQRDANDKRWVGTTLEINNRIKEIQLDEFEFRTELAIQKAKQLDDDTKNTSNAAEKKLLIAEQLKLELAQIETDKFTKKRELDEQEKIAGLEMQEFMRSLQMERQIIDATEQERKTMELDAWREKQLATLSTMNIDWMAALAMKVEIHRAYIAKKRIIDEKDDSLTKKRNKQMLSAAATLGQNLLGLWSALLSSKLKTLNETYAKERQWIEDNVTDEAEKKKKLEELDKKHAEKTNAIKRKQALAEKAGGIASAIINTASGIMTAYAQLGAFALPLAILIGAAGAAQIATIVATPIPFAEGGITTGPTRALIGEEGEEAVIPLDRLPEIFAEMGGAELEGGFGGSTNINITIAAMDSEDVAKFVDDKLIPILEDRFETQNFQVDPIAVRS